MGGGGSARGAAGERWRRSGGGAATGARILVRTGTGQANALHGQLHQGLGDALRWLVGPGDEREAEFVVGCPAVAAGEIPPASWQLE
jgi:predicted NBD/HSP70 family sugar kinase